MTKCWRAARRLLYQIRTKSNITFSFVSVEPLEGANHYYSGPDQRETLREAVGICTDWLTRHGFPTPEDTTA